MRNQTILAVALAGIPFAMAGRACAQVPLYEFGAPSGDYSNGSSTRSAGDVNGDGVVDFIVGAPDYWNPTTGSASVFSGRDGTRLYTFVGVEPSGQFGFAVSGVGDVNHDGFADVIVGAPHGSNPLGIRTGLAQVYSGRDGSVLFSFFGDNFGESFGTSVSDAGDVNGDGYPDIIVGAPTATSPTGHTGAGFTRVFSGFDGSVLFTFYGSQNSVQLGQSVAGAGDIDGDGHADVIVGVPNDSIFPPASGSARIYSGANGLLLRFLASTTDFQLGLAVRPIGDFNNDGVPDVVVGGYGVARVFSGKDGTSLLAATGLFSPPSNGYPAVNLGEFVDGIGDYDGDGFADIVVGTPTAVRLISGRTGAVLYSVLPFAGDADFGRSVARIGDINGDGFADLLIGTPFTGSGLARVFLLGQQVPSTYCTAKINSQACVPSIGSSGVLSLSVGVDDFYITAQNTLNNVNGLLFWGYNSASIPFGAGGILCVKPPIVRTTIQNSGGNSPPSDCSGAYAFHFSRAYVASVGLTVGTTVRAQYWSRDPGYSPPINFGLTNALEFTVIP